MEQKEKLFLQLLRNKFDFYIDKFWDDLIICQKNFDLDCNYEIVSKTVNLQEGDNKFYIIVENDSNDKRKGFLVGSLLLFYN